MFCDELQAVMGLEGCRPELTSTWELQVGILFGLGLYRCELFR